MPSPTCTVNATATTNGVNVTASTTVTIALADIGGVSQWSISCIGTDELLDAATVTAGLTINQTNKTATFTAPAAGSALIFQSKINNGQDINGRSEPTYTTTFGVYVLHGNGHRVAAVNETTEGSAAFGWTGKYNALARKGLANGSAMGQLPVWNQSTSQWVPLTSTAAQQASLYRLSATSDVQFDAPNVAIAFVASSGLLSLCDNGFGTNEGIQHNTVQTTDATVTTAFAKTMGDNTTHTIVATITADQSSGANSAGYVRMATVKRAGGGATLVGTVSTPHTAEDVAGWDATIDVNSNDWRVRVTGAAATTINWRCVIHYVPQVG